MKYSLIGERILLTLWVGGMWIVGYVVAPTLFAMLDDRIVAGVVAGRLFAIISYVGLVCGGLLVVGQLARSGKDWAANARLWTLIAMLVIIVAAQFGLTPIMNTLRDSGLPEGSAEAARFARLHGIAGSLFLINSLLGLGLVAFGLDARSSHWSANAGNAKAPRSQSA